jgi:hypothetical protein
MESRLIRHLQVWTASVMVTLTDALARSARRDDDRGDVPGWVMITVMTAIIRSTLHRCGAPNPAAR